MRIAIPVDEDQEMVCVSFGRTPYFLIYDTESGKREVKENSAAQAESGAGIQAAQFVADAKAEVLITPRCGVNSADVLKEAEIRIYKSEGLTATENLTAFEENKLSLLEKFHAGYHGRR